MFCAHNSVFVKKSTKKISKQMWTSCIIQTLTQCLFWFFVMILRNTLIFLRPSKPVDVVFGQPITQTTLPCPTFVQAKKLNKHNFVKKKEFRKSRIFGDSDATNWLLIRIKGIHFFNRWRNFKEFWDYVLLQTEKNKTNEAITQHN